MNRLIIIGNGFDLANGLKTSYYDFIIHYFKKVVTECSKKENYTDKLISVRRHGVINNPEWVDNYKTLNEIYEFANANHYKFNFTDLFSLIFHQLNNSNWVDIEHLYYHQLKKCLAQNKREEIILLNEQFDELKKQLAIYIDDINSAFQADEELLNLYIAKFTNGFKSHENSIIEGSFKKYNQCIILNFNYTNYLAKPVSNLDNKLYKIIHIHGDIADKENIIFGFGDDTDKSYQEIEELNDNRFFEHIKSFNYLKSHNYNSVFSLIENTEDPFEVLVFGHSLGLSDRTMFSQIFNNPNLHSVKLFYHEKPDGSNDFISKTHEISRHFKDKGKMRLKIVSFEKSEKMLQATI